MMKRIKCKKVSYNTISACKEGAKRLSEKYGGMIDVHGYVCNHCGKFHLTTSEFHKGGKFDTRVF